MTTRRMSAENTISKIAHMGNDSPSFPSASGGMAVTTTQKG